MDGFREIQDQLKEAGITVIAASSDAQDVAQESADKYGIPIGYGIDEATIKSLGGYWEDQREFSQPAEFILEPGGSLTMVSYSDGPLSRMEASDTIKSVNFHKSQQQK